MLTFTATSHFDAPAPELFAWHMRPGAFERLVPPWDSTRIASRSGRIEDDSMIVELSVPLAGPMRGTWTIRHDSYEPGRQFRDVMATGPFKRWEHLHRVDPADGGAGVGSTLTDTIDVELPLGALGRAGGSRMVRRRLESTFAWRHATTAADLAAHERAGASSPLRIAVTGANGMIGRALWAYLSTAGHEVIPIVRRVDGSEPGATYDLPASAAPIIWDPAAGTIDAARLEGIDAVVHLAGEPVVGRWTSDKRARIIDSRVDGTRLIAETLAGLDSPPAVLVSASAIGIYGDRGEETLDDGSGSGDGFLGEVARAWEGAADPARAAGIRVVHPRIGLVLTPAGGALEKLLTPMRFGAGGPLGSGRQWWSWITLDDVLGALEWAITCADVEGPVNLVAPEAMRMKDVAKAVGRQLRRPTIMPAPATALRIALGRDLADEMLLASQRIAPTSLLASGYDFRDINLDSALARMLGTARLGAVS